MTDFFFIFSLFSLAVGCRVFHLSRFFSPINVSNDPLNMCSEPFVMTLSDSYCLIVGSQFHEKNLLMAKWGRSWHSC